MCIFAVTPLAGVWIEIPSELLQKYRETVTPLAGVWIEIIICCVIHDNSLVTPLAGVWIEIKPLSAVISTVLRHSPCGSVD